MKGYLGVWYCSLMAFMSILASDCGSGGGGGALTVWRWLPDSHGIKETTSRVPARHDTPPPPTQTHSRTLWEMGPWGVEGGG